MAAGTPKFSSRLAWSLEENALTRAVATRRADGLPVLDLTVSNPTAAGFAWDAGALADAYAAPANSRYSPVPRGNAAARAAIADYYAAHGAGISPEQIHLCASTSEGYAWLLKLLADPGDNALAPAPSYPLLQFLADLDGVSVANYPLLLDAASGRWRVDTAALERAITPRTRVLLCVSPNNPTGTALDDADRAILRDAALRHNLAIIADEVFLDFPAGSAPAAAGTRPTTWATERTAPLFVLGGLSKTALLPQAKLAWIITAGSPAFRDAALPRLDIIADTYLSAGTAVQNALPALLAGAEPLRAAVRARCDINELRLRNWCAGSPHHPRLLPRDAGWTALVALPRGVAEDTSTLSLLRRDGVLVHPGYFYDTAPATGAFWAISLLTPTDTLDAALPALDAALARN